MSAALHGSTPASSGLRIGVRRVLLMLLPLVLVLLAWWPALDAPYQYDDYVTPLKDPASQSLRSWLHGIPQTLRPLTKLSYALESSLGAVSAPARRVLQMTLFLTTSAVIAMLARLSGLRTAPAAALATLWAIHPVHAEMLIALAGRSVLLTLFLTLLSASCLLTRRSGLALGCAVLAVLARETALPWLVVCTGMIVWQRGVTRVRLTAAVLGASLLGVTLVLASTRLRALLMFSFADASAFNRLGLQWAALSKGTLLLGLDPGAFSVDMDFAPLGPQRVLYLLASIAMYAGALWLALRPRSDLTLRTLAWLWICLVIPLHSIVPKLDPLTARSNSASSAALICLLAVVLAGQRVEWARVRLVFWVAVAGLLVMLVPITRGRAALYDDPVALWRDAARRSTHGTRPLVNLGTLLAQRGQLDEAKLALEEAVRRNPHGSDERERLRAVGALLATRRLLTEPHLDATPQEDEPPSP